jgi:hypothetical protein
MITRRRPPESYHYKTATCYMYMILKTTGFWSNTRRRRGRPGMSPETMLKLWTRMSLRRWPRPVLLFLTMYVFLSLRCQQVVHHTTQPPRPVSTYVDPADRVASSKPPNGNKANDDIQTWSVSEVDKKGKKKKGTLGVGNGTVFFASLSDKVSDTHYVTASSCNNLCCADPCAEMAIQRRDVCFF